MGKSNALRHAKRFLYILSLVFIFSLLILKGNVHAQYCGDGTVDEWVDLNTCPDSNFNYTTISTVNYAGDYVDDWTVDFTEKIIKYDFTAQLIPGCNIGSDFRLRMFYRGAYRNGSTYKYAELSNSNVYPITWTFYPLDSGGSCDLTSPQNGFVSPQGCMKAVMNESILDWTPTNYGGSSFRRHSFSLTFGLYHVPDIYDEECDDGASNDGTQRAQCSLNQVCQSCYCDDVPVPGECKVYGSTYLTQPASDNASGCEDGTYSNRSNTSSDWRWRCNGENGGATVNCAATKEYCGNTAYDPSQGEECDASAGASNCSSCRCETGYSANGSGQCVPDVSCSATAPSTNATACNDGGIPGSANQANTVESICSPSVACDWTCDLGYEDDGSGSCVPARAQCGETVTDYGGVGGNYGNNENWTVLVCPDNAGDVVTLDFQVSLFEQGPNDCTNAKDYLDIHNGDSLSNLVIERHCNSTANHTITSTDVSGCLLLHFVSDGSLTEEGFEADVLCGPPATDAECVAYPSVEYSQPASDDATGCVSGTYIDAADTGTHWVWTCDAPDGYTDQTCQALKPYCGDTTCDGALGETCSSCATDCGVCTPAICTQHTGIYSAQPASDDATGCDSGTFGEGDDTTAFWNWTCLGGDGVTTDQCSARKGLGTCGNGGDPELGEECDDGNFNPYDECTNECTVARCGDGIVQAGVEECDRNIGCDTSCQWIEPLCTLEADTVEVLLGSEVTFTLGYPTNVSGPLVYECVVAGFCGDGFVDPDGGDNILGNSDDEKCDDGNTSSNDGCSSTCKFDIPDLANYENACTNGTQDPLETGIDCGGTCKACESCFDGINNGDETGIDCGGSCLFACPTCFDGIQNGGETGIDCGGGCTTCS